MSESQNESKQTLETDTFFSPLLPQDIINDLLLLRFVFFLSSFPLRQVCEFPATHVTSQYCKELLCDALESS